MSIEKVSELCVRIEEVIDYFIKKKNLKIYFNYSEGEYYFIDDKFNELTEERFDTVNKAFIWFVNKYVKDFYG